MEYPMVCPMGGPKGYISLVKNPIGRKLPWIIPWFIRWHAHGWYRGVPHAFFHRLAYGNTTENAMVCPMVSHGICHGVVPW